MFIESLKATFQGYTMKQHFKIVLNSRGEYYNKGGNKAVLGLPCQTIKAENRRKAEEMKYKIICETVGSASESLYDLLEVKE
jgi:hypothetical protein